MKRQFKKIYRRDRIKSGLRKRIRGSAERPRLTVYRSNDEIYAQIIDDAVGHTLVSASSRDAVDKSVKTLRADQARQVGMELAKRALEAQVSAVVFDRNGYPYHGRVKALAEGAREGGLSF